MDIFVDFYNFLLYLYLRRFVMYKNGNRMMAWIAKIEEVKPIENADQIVAYRVGGWWVVDKKNAYNVGDLAVYVSIDSWIPNQLAPFLSKGQEPRQYNGVRGERLRTVRLKGQLSQGLLLPFTETLADYAKDFDDEGQPFWMGPEDFFQEGEDVSEVLGIQKWEAPIPAQLAGDARGMFPSFIPKTDQERIQNLVAEVAEWADQGMTFEVTEKLDGSSMTVYDFDGDQGVCSRNLNLKETAGNSLWAVARRDQLLEKIQGRSIALQGELIGEGIQGNPYKIKGQQYLVYDIYDIRTGQYFNPERRRDFCQTYDIAHVPVYGQTVHITETVPEMLIRAEKKSTLNSQQEQEGVVFKCNQDPQISFKCISNKFLIKTGS
jgi:RNA ligase (TIGR02306 family)